MDNTERQMLREAAEKATPGPWISSGRDVQTIDGKTIAVPVFSADEEFIALADPHTVLRLLDELDKRS